MPPVMTRCIFCSICAVGRAIKIISLRYQFWRLLHGKKLLFLITSVYRIIVIINRIICFIINGLSHSLHSAWLFFGIFFILIGNTQINLFQVYFKKNLKINSNKFYSSLLSCLMKPTSEQKNDVNKFGNPTLNLTSLINNRITFKSLLNDSPEHEIMIEGIISHENRRS